MKECPAAVYPEPADGQAKNHVEDVIG